MTKEAFILELNQRLKGYPDANDIVSYYYELVSDRLEAGETEEEVFQEITVDEIMASLGRPTLNSEEKKSFEEPIVLYREKDENKGEEFKEPKEGPKPLHGGRLFWYQIFRIASVCFCIAAVCVEIVSICLLGCSIGALGASAAVFRNSVGLGIAVVGVGLFLMGAGFVALHYSIVLRKFVFSKRIKWNQSVYEGLGGRR